MEITILFRYLSIVLGLGIGLFSIGILRRSPKANKGWNYMAMNGILLSIWAIVQTGSQFIITNASLLSTIKSLSSFILFLGISYCELMVFIFLSQSFEIKLPKIYSIKNANILFFSLLIILVLYNFLTPYPTFLYELSGIAHLMLGLSFGFSIYPAYKIAKTTKKWFWTGNLVFISLVFIGVILGVMHTTSCNDPINPYKDICPGMNKEYAPVIPFFFNTFIISLSSKYHIFILLGLISAVTSYGGIYKKLG